MTHEAERLVLSPGLVSKVPGSSPGGQPAKTVAVPSKPEREEVMRIVAMGSNPRQPVHGRDDRKVPTPGGRQPRNNWIAHRQLVHELRRSLNNRFVPLPVLDRRSG